MSMRVTQLTTHWEAEEAFAVIEFLDTLRHALWNSHGEQIEQMLRGNNQDRRTDEEQMGFDFDDPIPF